MIKSSRAKPNIIVQLFPIHDDKYTKETNRARICWILVSLLNRKPSFSLIHSRGTFPYTRGEKQKSRNNQISGKKSIEKKKHAAHAVVWLVYKSLQTMINYCSLIAEMINRVARSTRVASLRERERERHVPHPHLHKAKFLRAPKHSESSSFTCVQSYNNGWPIID